MSNATSRRTLGGRAWLSYLVMGALALFFLFPVAIMVIGSFKPNTTVITDQTSLRAFDPRPFQGLDNYSSAADTGSYFTSLRVSLIVSTVVVVGGLFVNSLFGYALARLRFGGQRILLGLVVALIIIPFEALAVPLLLMMSEIGWTNTIRAQYLPFIAQPLYIFLFYSFFKGLPTELEEAATIDGAGPYRTFFSVIFPLARPAYASAAILTFLYSWGQFLWPVMIARTEDVRPLPIGLTFFRGTPPFAWADLLAYATMMVLPVVIVFVIFQRHFIEGVASSGLKG